MTAIMIPYIYIYDIDTSNNANTTA